MRTFVAILVALGLSGLTHSYNTTQLGGQTGGASPKLSQELTTQPHNDSSKLWALAANEVDNDKLPMYASSPFEHISLSELDLVANRETESRDESNETRAILDLTKKLQKRYPKSYRMCQRGEFQVQGLSDVRHGRPQYHAIRKNDGKNLRLIATAVQDHGEFVNEVMTLYALKQHPKLTEARTVFPVIECVGYNTHLTELLGTSGKVEKVNYFVTSEIRGQSLSSFAEHENRTYLSGKLSSLIGGTLLALSKLHEMDHVYLQEHLGAYAMDVDGAVTLTDFRRAVNVRSSSPVSRKCLAPETKRFTKGKHYNAKVDVYNLGTIFSLLYRSRICCTECQFMTKFGFKDLLAHMLAQEPRQRWSTDKLLQHPFLQVWGERVLEFLFPTSWDAPECDFTHYWLIGMLGQGADAKTYLLQHKGTGVHYVLKVGKANAVEGMRDEIGVMHRLRDTHIGPKLSCFHSGGPVQLVRKGALFSLAENAPAYVMDFINGTTLSSFWKNRLSTRPSFRVAHSIFLAQFKAMMTQLKQLHSLGIVHLDPHTENWIFTDQGSVPHLIDFGRSRDLCQPRHDALGYPPEINPEINPCSFGSLTKYSEATDVHALAYTMLDFYANVILPECRVSVIPKQLKAVWKQMLSSNPTKRPTFESVLKSDLFDRV
jgi:serine/threonine protein kinase